MKNHSSFLLFFIASLIFSSSFFLSNGADEEFSYREETGRGPKNWGKINPQWATCETGKAQSPIDIIDSAVKISHNLGHIERDYKPAPAILKDRGHDIMVSWEGQNAGKIKINGVDYKLLQCHWHSPSEHKINGITFDEELHILHQDSKGVRAVISVLFKIGSPDPFISKLFNHIKSLHPNEEKKLGIVDPGTIGFWSGKYYRYIGSLTIPPCTEGVVWTIFAHPKTLSAEQVQALKEALSDESRENARPIQHLHGRLVEASSH